MLKDIERKRAALRQINLMLFCPEISDDTRNALLADKERISCEMQNAIVDMARIISREGVGALINP